MGKSSVYERLFEDSLNLCFVDKLPCLKDFTRFDIQITTPSGREEGKQLILLSFMLRYLDFLFVCPFIAKIRQSAMIRLAKWGVRSIKPGGRGVMPSPLI